MVSGLCIVLSSIKSLSRMKNKKWIIVFLIIALISVKFYYLYLSNMNNNYSTEMAYNKSDAGHYLIIAKNISDFMVYSDINSNVATENATWRPPFWPFILSLFFRLSSEPIYIILLKSILELVVVLGVLFKFNNKINLKLIWLAPFFLIFIEPHYLKYSITFLSESVTAVLIFSLAICFITLDDLKRHHILIPILCGLIILCHPVSIFFILSIFIIYLYLNYKSNFSLVLLHGLLFSLIVLAWPCRNYLTFHKGFYITASQGATFSKGWNERVVTQFTNVEGDLEDESINLKFIDKDILLNSDKSILSLSKLYTEGTRKFIGSISFQEKLKIIYVKLKSNFNPFPENPKPGFLETISILFRSLYLIVFLQLIYRFYTKVRIDFSSMTDRVYLIVLAIFIGQITMSIYVYTGLRFNSIYSLTLFFCFIFLNIDIFVQKILKLKFPVVLK